MEACPHEEEMKDIVLGYKRRIHCRMVFEDNEGGRDY